jgi:hypothetical protein
VKKRDELMAYQLCVRFKRGVYALVRKHPEAYRDYKWREQLWSAVADAEEAQRRLIDGVHRGYYTEAECEPVLVLGRRSGAATMGLLRSLQ